MAAHRSFVTNAGDVSIVEGSINVAATVEVGRVPAMLHLLAASMIRVHREVVECESTF